MKLIFHFGQQKAGSTALQNALYENRALLREHGILYPAPQPPHTDHGALSRLIFEEERWPRQITKRVQREPGKVSRHAASILRQIRDAGKRGSYHTVLLSSEYFFRHLEEGNVEKLRRHILDHFDEASFIAYIRHPVPRYLSSCLQKVRHSSRIPRPGSAGFRGVLSSYAAVFPVTVRAHDPVALTGGDIVRDFLASVLPEMSGVTLAPSDRDVNKAISAEIASIVQDYRHAVYPDQDDVIHTGANKLRNTLLRLSRTHDLDRRASLKPAVARHIEEQAAKELQWLEETHGVTFPGYEAAPEDVPEIEPKKLRWIHQVCRVNQVVKGSLTAHLLHEQMTQSLGPSGPGLRSLVKKGLRRLRDRVS